MENVAKGKGLYIYNKDLTKLFRNFKNKTENLIISNKKNPPSRNILDKMHSGFWRV